MSEKIFIHSPHPTKSTTETIERLAKVTMNTRVPLEIRRSGVPITVHRGSKYTQEYEVYGTFANTSPTNKVEKFSAKLLISSKQWIIWSEDKMAPLIGPYGFVDYHAIPGDILTYAGDDFRQRFRYMVREPESCGLTEDIAFRVKLLSREDLP